jgi:hypothetical protein
LTYDSGMVINNSIEGASQQGRAKNSHSES